MKTFLIICLLAGALCSRAEAPYQHRAIFWEPAPANPEALIYGFDDGDVHGRFGNGLRLTASESFSGDCSTRQATVAFSFRLDALPAEKTPLLRLMGGGTPLTVALDQEGRLFLDAYGIRQAETVPVVLAGRWLHLAVLTRAAYVNQSWQGDVEIQLDGETLILMTNTPGLVNHRSETFRIGPGLDGVIDDVRSLRKPTPFYADHREWVDPTQPPPSVAEADRITHWTCDEPSLTDELPGVYGGAFRIGKDIPPLRETVEVAPSGTLAFWLRPMDWDNLHKASNWEKAGSTRLLSLGDILSVAAFIRPRAERSGIEPLTPGRWTHVAITWQGDDVLTYVNGKPRAAGGFSVVCKAKPVISQAVLETAVSDKVSTAVDEIRLYRRALSPAEIAAHVPLVEAPPPPQLDVRVESNGVLGWLKVWVWPLELTETTTGTLELRHEGKVLARAELTLIPGQYGFARLETQPLPFGKLEVVVAADHIAGGTTFTREKPPWYDNNFGVSDKVMPGWTPIEVDGNTVRISRREITLAGSGFPEQIMSVGKPILAAPVALTADAALQPGELTITTHSESRLDWRGTLRSDTWHATVDGYLEYDGMMWFDVTLAPNADTATIDTLTLTIPYSEDADDLHHWWSGDMKFAAGRTFRHLTTTNTGDVLPEGEGVIFRSNDAEAVFLPPELRGSFIPYVMVTGMERGMAWFAESDRGWTQSTETPAVTVERHHGAVRTVLRIITEPVTLDAPRTFAFGLHPTPVKALPENWRMNAGLVTYPDGQTGNSLKGPTKATHFDQLPLDEDWEAVLARAYGKDSPDDFAGRMWRDYQGEIERFTAFWGREPSHLEVTVPGIYLNQAWVGAFPEHSEEWQATVYRNRGPWATYTDAFQDFAAWALTQWIVQTDGFVRGTYIDDTWPSPQLEGPCTYTLPDGHLQPGWQWRAYRKRYKRMRQIFLDHGIAPQLIAHHTNTYYIPYMSFFDVVYDGEWLYTKHPETKTFLDKWSMGRLRFAHHAKWGIITAWLSWGGAEEANSRKQFPEWGYRMDRAYVAALAVHDIKWRFNTDNIYDRPSVFHREFGLREPDTAFIPYWDDHGLATHSHDEFYISAWKRPGKCLVILVNGGDERLDAKVKLSDDVMGLSGTLKVTDVDPTLIRSFETETPKPKAELMSMLDDAIDTEPRNKDAAFIWQDGVLTCPVRSDDFRLFIFEETP